MAGITEVATALWTFYNQFLPSFQNDLVPDGQTFPYLAHEVIVPSYQSDMTGDVPQSVILYDKSQNYQRLYSYADQISEAIAYGGKSLKLPDGYLWMFRGTPFMQNYVLTQEEQGQNIKAVYLNIGLRAHFI